MRTTVDIDVHLLRRLRIEAGRRSLPFKQLLNRVIQLGLDAEAKSDPYFCPTFSMGEALPSMNLDKALRLAGELEDEEAAREIERRK
jgi:hypothetical protein